MARTVQQTRARGIAAICAIMTLAVAAPAPAKDGPPGSEDSAVNQYAEVVPGAGGPTAPGVGRKQRSTLPRAADDALSQAPPATASPLEKIATSSTYGAPAILEERRKPVGERNSVPPDASFDATLRSTAAAIGSASDARLIGMLGVLLLTTLVAVALAIGRARRTPR